MTRHHGRTLALLGLLALAGPPSATAANAVQGSDRARGVLPPGVRVEPYSNSSYALRALPDGEFLVEVAVFPLRSRTLHRPPARLATSMDAVDRVARSLASGALLQAEVAERVLAWVGHQIAYSADRRAPQEAHAVLARRGGYCTGIARLTVALLRAAGLEAREVPGWVADDGAGRFHRWVEFRLDDRGWVFSDPLRSHGFVPATYVRLAGEHFEGDPAAGAPGGLLIERDERLIATATTVERASIAPNDVRAGAASLHVSAPGWRSISLEGHGFLRTMRAAGTEGRFLDLAPGRYRLDLVGFDGARETRTVEFSGRGPMALHLPARLVRSAEGKATR